MTATPAMTEDRTDPQSLADIATAAAVALPSPQPLRLGPTDGSLSPGRTGTAVSASFTGAVAGEVVLIVDPALEDALSAAEGGGLSVADAVQPALEAAVAVFGPSVLGAVEVHAAADAVSREDLDWVPLVGEEEDGSSEVSVWVGVVLSAPEGGGGGATRGGAGSAAAAVVAEAVAAGPVRTEAGGLALLRDVEMTLTVELGRTSMPVRDLLALAPGSVVELDRAAGAPADLMVNGRLLARGEIVVVDEDYGLRITEIVDPSSEA